MCGGRSSSALVLASAVGAKIGAGRAPGKSRARQRAAAQQARERACHRAAARGNSAPIRRRQTTGRHRGARAWDFTARWRWSPARARASARRRRRRLAEAGARVVLVARNEEKILEAAGAIGDLALRGALRRHRSRRRRRALRHDRRPLRPARRGFQQRRRRAHLQGDRRRELGRMAACGRREPRRRLPDRARRLPDDARAVAQGRADHQQRLDLGDDAAARLDRLHRLETCDHRA